MSFEEKNLIKDLKKLSFTSFTPFVSIPEPSATVSLTTHGQQQQSVEDILVEDDSVENNRWRMVQWRIIGGV